MWTYLLYLAPFAVILAIALWDSNAKVLKDEPAYIEYALATVFLLTLWGELATAMHEWYFNSSGTLGLFIGDHPIEAFIQAFIMPLLIVSVWESVKRKK